MSSIRFEDLTSQTPELLPVWQQLRAWRQRNPRVRVFELSRLARELSVSSGDLITAFVVLSNLGAVRPVFQVKEPTTHVLQGEDFDDPLAIPPVLRDRFDKPFETDDCEIVPVYREIEPVLTSGTEDRPE